MINADTIQAGLAANEFYLEYLPTVRLADQVCVGAEALSRWARPAGAVPPDHFVPLIERTHLSGALTYWVIDTVAAELLAWLKAHPAASVSLNVPPELLGRGSLQYAADKSGLSAVPTQIILELTERGIPDDIGMNSFGEAERRGIRFALDDITLSGANAAILTRCHFRVVKLDRSLVWEITPDNPRPEWLGRLAPLLVSDDLTVVAEGVETALQARQLAGAGVPLAQGYYFSRPLRAEAFMAYYAANRGG